MMSILQLFGSKKTRENNQEAAKVLSDAVKVYSQAVNDAAAQYNETRKKAEERINSGARITRHQIDL